MIEFISQFQAQYASGGGGGQAQYGGETDDNIAMLEKAVPGTPGEDYPIYAEVGIYELKVHWEHSIVCPRPLCTYSGIFSPKKNGFQKNSKFFLTPKK